VEESGINIAARSQNAEMGKGMKKIDPSPLAGQWIGTANGTNEGLVVLELDDKGDELRGHACLYEAPDTPGTLVPIRIPNQGGPIAFDSITLPFDPRQSRTISELEIGQLFPDYSFPKTVKITLEITSRNLIANWTTDLGTNGTARLQASRAHQKSSLKPNSDVNDWNQFKELVSKVAPHEFMFRGQDVPARLRTSFHRSNRKDLLTFLNQDIPEAHRVLTARTKHVFRLSDPQENGAFWNLLQHHGYPTPLLDWTHSPYVAAFFAFRYGAKRTSNQKNVRIFVFNRAQWERDYPQLQSATLVQPHFSILQALTIENNRALPQQALSSVTNIDDIESYLTLRERQTGNNYLEVIDLPFSERRTVMRELSMMGITAGSLFPGLDGACEELRGRFFGPVR
jgi:hypothetical protein